MTSVESNERRGKIQTVSGLIEPAALGATLMHEHLLWDVRAPQWREYPDQGPELSLANHWRIDHCDDIALNNMVHTDEAGAISEVELMKAAGGQAIVELSNGGLSPAPAALRRIAEATGVQIIMGSGQYVDEYQDPANHDRSVDDFAAEIIAQIETGAWGSEVRAGLIGEIGCQSPWTALEKRVMAGAVVAQQTTGAAINIHPGREADQPQEAIDFIRAEGGDVARVIVSHIDRTIFDDERLFRLADSGCIIELDLFGMEQSFYPWNLEIYLPNDAERLRWLRRLIERGHGEQLVISHDICFRTRLSRFGGHGYGHIFENVMPQMARRGFSETEIEQIMIKTPRRLLTFV